MSTFHEIIDGMGRCKSVLALLLTFDRMIKILEQNVNTGFTICCRNLQLRRRRSNKKMDTVTDHTSGLRYEAVRGLEPSTTLAIYNMASKALSGSLTGENILSVEPCEYKHACDLLMIIDKKIAGLYDTSRSFVRGKTKPIGLLRYFKTTTLKIGNAKIGVSTVE